MDARQPEGPLVLAGRFRCDRLPKRGRGVDTWLATDLEADGLAVVVKTVAADGVGPATRTRLEHEAAVLRRLEGPSIAPLVASGREGHLLYLVQPFVEGITLRDRLAAGPLPVADALRVGVDVAAALQAAHEAGVVHLDVKPANVMVDSVTDAGGDAGALRRAVLVDFGLAKSAGLDPSVRDEPVGTARYLAPEAAGLLDAPADERADLYSLGVLLFECLAGRPPFEGAGVGEVLRQHLSEPRRRCAAWGQPCPAPSTTSSGVSWPRTPASATRPRRRSSPTWRPSPSPSNRARPSPR